MKTRRDFLRSTVLGASAAWTVPMFIERTFGQLHEGARDLAIQPVTGKDDTILVVLQLAGGNDGLNTLVPFADDAYHKARPRLAKKEKDIIKLSDHVGLNASMPFLGSLFKEGDLGIVQGVGYPNPNRSHFVSTSIWETADTNNRSATGWLGRYFDNACPGADPTVGISFNKTQPESLRRGEKPRRLPQFARTLPLDPRRRRKGPGRGILRRAQQARPTITTMTRPSTAAPSPCPPAEKPAASPARAISPSSNASPSTPASAPKKILELAAKHKTTVRYDGTPLARNLNLVARMIAGGMPTRVYYVSHGGFDTHNQQVNSHDRLLGQLDSALEILLRRSQGTGERQARRAHDLLRVRPPRRGKRQRRHRPRQGLLPLRRRTRHQRRPPRHAPQPHRSHPKATSSTPSISAAFTASVLTDWLKAPDLKPILGGNYPKMGMIG